MSRHETSRSTPWVFTAATLAGGLALFFAMPVRASASAGALVRDTVIALVGIAVVGWVVVRQVRGSGRREMSPIQLVMLAEIVICVFALTYYSLWVHDGTQFVGLRTRLDALYFTLTTTTTVGYGDVHASGQLARALVCIQLAFNLVFLGLLAQLVRRRLGSSPG